MPDISNAEGSTNLATLCYVLKMAGVQEVILDVDNFGKPIVEFNGFDGKWFKIRATNKDFADNDL